MSTELTFDGIRDIMRNGGDGTKTYTLQALKINYVESKLKIFTFKSISNIFMYRKR